MTAVAAHTQDVGARAANPDCWAAIRLLTEDAHYLSGEPIAVYAAPPGAQWYELRIARGHTNELERRRSRSSRFDLKDHYEPGVLVLRARWSAEESPDPAVDTAWSDWSIPLTVTIHAEASADEVQALHRREHQLSRLLVRDVHGAITLADPWALPPAHPPRPEDARWFRTAVYEGRTPLINETREYYEHPSAYLRACMNVLRERGVTFVTWHDLLDGRFISNETQVLVQFDVDGGVCSLERLLPDLMESGVRGSVMMHCEAYDWYEYTLDDQPIDLLRDAERHGWTIGYHQNAVGNTQRLARSGDYGDSVMHEARQRFADDVRALREHFTIRAWTAHGGNVLNHRLAPPGDLDITCVDRTNAPLWKFIRSMFSDGGFTARPTPLREKVDAITPGLHFFRLHPFKYGNYDGDRISPPNSPPDFPPDSLPLVEADAIRRGMTMDEPQRAFMREEQRKQDAWLAHRRAHRLGRLLSNAGVDHPLSASFMPIASHDLSAASSDHAAPPAQERPATAAQLASLITHFRARRKPFFLREYPDPLGDPRVFWWRLLHVFAPQHGEVLNVGALPPAQRDETTSFLAPSVRVVEMDIDAAREPHILGDITQSTADARARFDGVLLFGLPYVHSPGAAIEQCAAVTKRGGVGLFGFPDEMHPMRGHFWNGDSRPLWRRVREPLDDVGLQGRLWSFDRTCLDDLFRAWSEVRIESHSHYWFVAASNDA